ncbi:MAG: PKD domain-containing protein, partial [Planctomycetota bacterium]
DRSGIDDTNAASYDWSFGNNQQATGQSVSHEFPGIKPHDVTLTVTAPNGEKASVTRRIYPPSEPATRMTIHMDAQFENEMPILQAGRTAHLKLFVKNTSSLPHDVVFKNLIARDTDDTSPEVVDKQKIEQLEPASDGPEGWHIIRTSFALPTDNVYSQLKLLMHNRPIVEKEVAVMSTDGPLGALQVDQSGTLRDAKNRLVLLRLSCTKSRETPPQEIYHPRTGLVRLLVIDDQLAGPADPDNQNDYIAKLIEQLNSEYPALEFVAVRPTMNLPDESSTISHFLETRRKTLESNANIVIITSQPETVLNNVPKDAFQSYLIATLDQIGSQTSAARMLVTPPPLPGLPELSSEYASIVKQVGIKMGITVGDVYSRLRLTPNWKKLFRQDASQHPSYQIHLNNNGQELVAREIFNSLIRKFGDRFSAAEEAFRQRN